MKRLIPFVFVLALSLHTPAEVVYSLQGGDEDAAAWDKGAAPQLSFAIGESSRLTLRDLPEHEFLRITFTAVMPSLAAQGMVRIRGLNRNQPVPRLRVVVDESTTVVDTSFSQSEQPQSFPDLAPGFAHAPGTGLEQEAKQRQVTLSVRVPHRGESATLTFGVVLPKNPEAPQPKLRGPMIMVAGMAAGSNTTLLRELVVEATPAPTDGLDAAGFAQRYEQLAAEDPALAARALQDLVADPATLERIAAELAKPVEPVDVGDLATTVANLDHESFAVRKAARESLMAMDAAVVPRLRELKAESESPEVKVNLTEIINKLKKTTGHAPEQARANRLHYLLSLHGKPGAELAASLPPVKPVTYHEAPAPAKKGVPQVFEFNGGAIELNIQGIDLPPAP